MRSGRRRPLSPREQKEQRSSRNARIAGLGVVLFMLVAGGMFFVASRVNPELGANLCPTDRPPQSDVVVILDATDAWNPTQRAAIHAEFERIQDAVPRFARVRLFSLDTMAEQLPEAVLKLCNPGTVEDFRSVPVTGRFSARLFANPRQLERWRGEFESALDSLVHEIDLDAGATRSPIMETIRGIALSGFDDEAAGEPRLYVFSDMLQHSDIYSHYREEAWTFDQAERLADVSVAGTAYLRGVRVELFLVDRQIRGEGRGPGELVRFWETWFATQGAQVNRVRRLEG